MNYKEALNVIEGRLDDSLDELTKKYRSKVKEAHPDHGGSSEWFIDVRAAFKVILEQYKYKQKHKNESGEWEEKESHLSKELQEKLTEVLDTLNSDTIEISILGNWLWLSGNTYPSRSEIKKLGFKFSKNKTAWYWHHGEYKRRSKKVFSLEEIEKMHGKVPVEKSSKKLLTTQGGR